MLSLSSVSLGMPGLLFQPQASNHIYKIINTVNQNLMQFNPVRSIYNFSITFLHVKVTILLPLNIDTRYGPIINHCKPCLMFD